MYYARSRRLQGIASYILAQASDSVRARNAHLSEVQDISLARFDRRRRRLCAATDGSRAAAARDGRQDLGLRRGCGCAGLPMGAERRTNGRVEKESLKHKAKQQVGEELRIWLTKKQMQ